MCFRSTECCHGTIKDLPKRNNQHRKAHQTALTRRARSLADSSPNPADETHRDGCVSSLLLGDGWRRFHVQGIIASSPTRGKRRRPNVAWSSRISFMGSSTKEQVGNTPSFTPNVGPMSLKRCTALDLRLPVPPVNTWCRRRPTSSCKAALASARVIFSSRRISTQPVKLSLPTRRRRLRPYG